MKVKCVKEPPDLPNSGLKVGAVRDVHHGVAEVWIARGWVEPYEPEPIAASEPVELGEATDLGAVSNPDPADTVEDRDVTDVPDKMIRSSAGTRKGRGQR